MKKFAVALVSALALIALSAGAANASHCPPVGSSGNSTGGTGPVSFSVTDLWVYGEAQAAGSGGYGESDFGVVTGPAPTDANVTYSGELAGNGLLAGHGEVENGNVGTSGVSGTADGQVAGQSASGHLDSTGLTLQTAGLVARPCGHVP